MYTINADIFWVYHLSDSIDSELDQQRVSGKYSSSQIVNKLLERDLRKNLKVRCTYYEMWFTLRKAIILIT